MTNGEYIRSLDDEQLAKAMYALLPLDDRIDFCQNKPECDPALEMQRGVPDAWCIKCMEAWLKKEATWKNAND